MDKTTVIVLVVIVLLVVGVLMYQSSIQAQRDRELALQLQSMQNPQQPTANFWSSLGEWSNLIDTFSGLFSGSGTGAGTGSEGARINLENTDESPYISTHEAAQNGWDYLRAKVQLSNPYETEFNV